MGAISNLKFILLGTFIIFTPIVNSLELTKSNEKKPLTPHWEPLCDKLSPNDKQHQYLFSDETIDWTSAREMCEF